MSTSPFDNLPNPLPSTPTSTDTKATVTETPKAESKVEDKQPDELAMLKQQARIMGITHSNNISAETLAAKIKEKMDSMNGPITPMGPPPEPGSAPTRTVSIQEQVNAATKMPVQERKFTRHELKQAVRREQQLEYMKLVRVRVTCMNPAKADLQGEIQTVSNGFLGVTSRYVPFNTGPDGWHVEYILYLHMRDKKFAKTSVDKNGTPRTVDVNEFAIEVLPPLTEGQIRKLAQRQAMAEGTAQA
jgi:hypothetical protein